MKRKLTVICMIFATAFAVVACQSSDKSQTSNTKDKTETQTVKERIANRFRTDMMITVKQNRLIIMSKQMDLIMTIAI